MLCWIRRVYHVVAPDHVDVISRLSSFTSRRWCRRGSRLCRPPSARRGSRRSRPAIVDQRDEHALPASRWRARRRACREPTARERAIDSWNAISTPCRPGRWGPSCPSLLVPTSTTPLATTDCRRPGSRLRHPLHVLRLDVPALGSPFMLDTMLWSACCPTSASRFAGSERASGRGSRRR
jgi:hypothetical protein